MKNSYKKLFGGLLMLGALTFAGCHEPDVEIDTLDYSRTLQPLNFTASVDRATGYDVNFSWTIAENTDYLLSIQKVDEQGTAVGSPIDVQIPAAEAVNPYKVTLEAEQIYTATLQAFSALNPNLPGSQLVSAGPVETYYVMTSLKPELAARTMNSITVKWENDEGEQTQLTRIVAEPVDATSGLEPQTLEVTADIIQAQQGTVTGLNPSTQYVVTLYQSKSSRGGVTAWTAPDTEGATAVESSEALMEALKGGAEKILVKASAEPYVLDFGEATLENPNPNPLTAWTKNLTIYGEVGQDGAMPVVKGLGVTLKPGTSALSVLIENLVLDGDGEGVLVTFDPGADLTVDSYIVRNCEVTNYEKGLVYRGSGDKVLNVTEILFDGLYIHDLNANGSGGGDLFDLRAGTYGSFTLKNSTLIDAGRTFLFFDASAALTSINILNNTLNRVGLNTTRKGLVCLRQPAATFLLSKNLFLNEYSTSENVRLVSSYDNAQVPSMSGNYFYNVNYNSKNEENYTGPEFFTTKIGSNATAVNQSLCLSGDGKILASDPCVKSERNRMQLTNEDVIANQVGDPRWWTEEVPETVIASELTPVTEDYTWPLTDDLVFEPQSITETIIYGNLQFIASNETFPVTITSDHTISLSGATTLTADGIPTNNALAIRVASAGSLVLTPSNAGIGVQLEIIAGSDRYTVPCDGVEHTVGLGEIAGDTHVYITTTGAVVLSSLSWTSDVSVDGDLKTLATPEVTIAPQTVAWSSAQEIVLTWEAIANAASYAVTWNGQSPVTVTDTKWTIPASTVAGLAVGEYPIEVVARPVETSTKYKASEAAELKFEVTKVTLTTPQVTVTPASLNAGTAQEVQVSWPAVEGAASYDVTFNGVTTNQTETTLTLASDVVAAMAAGRYEITVVAKPVDTEHYADSAAGAGELELKAVGAAMTMTWNFSDAAWASTIEAVAAKGSDGSTDLDVTIDGLRVLAGGKNIRAGSNDAGSYFQPNGGGSTEERVFSFTAPASGTLTVVTSNTGSSAATGRLVKVQVGADASTEQSGEGATGGSDPVTNTFNLTLAGGETIYVYPSSGLRFYSIAFSYVAAPTATEKTMMLTKDNLADLGLPEGKSDVQALTAPSTWSYEGKAFESVMALSSTSNSASVKVPVLYLYKSTENAKLGANYIRTTEALGQKIQKITVTFVDSGKKKGNKLSMYEYVGGQKQLVLSDNESDSDAEVLTYVFSEANDGKFSLENVPRSGSEGDLKIVSIQIDYLGE